MENKPGTPTVSGGERILYGWRGKPAPLLFSKAELPQGSQSGNKTNITMFTVVRTRHTEQEHGSDSHCSTKGHQECCVSVRARPEACIR